MAPHVFRHVPPLGRGGAGTREGTSAYQLGDLFMAGTEPSAEVGRSVLKAPPVEGLLVFLGGEFWGGGGSR